MALTAVVLVSLLGGCQNNPPADLSKEPNKDAKAGPPNASPAELDQIRQHMQQSKH